MTREIKKQEWEVTHGVNSKGRRYKKYTRIEKGSRQR